MENNEPSPNGALPIPLLNTAFPFLFCRPVPERFTRSETRLFSFLLV